MPLSRSLSAPHALIAAAIVCRLCLFRDGILLVAQWLEETGFLRCSSAGLDNAAEGGHLHVLKVIFRQYLVARAFWLQLLGENRFGLVVRHTMRVGLDSNARR